MVASARPARLLPTLALTYAILGVAITALSLLGGWYVQQRNAHRSATRADVVAKASELSSYIGSASEEGFSFVLTGSAEEKERAFEKVDMAEAYARSLAHDAPLTSGELDLVTRIQRDIAVFRATMVGLFGGDERSGGVSPAEYDAYEGAIDEATEAVSELRGAALVENRRDGAAAQRVVFCLTAAWGVVLVALGVAAGLLIGRRITGPLLRLRDAAIAFGAGQLDVKLPVNLRGEIGELATAFSQMMAATCSHIETLRRAQQLEAELRQAQKLEGIGRLAGGVAHDFNNLLSVILSCSALLSENLAPDDPMRGELQDIETAGNRAADLTRQLLAFSRQQVLEPAVLELDAVVTGVARMLERVLGEDVELSVHAGAGSLQVEVDPGQIEQVIMNLAVNARDAMPQGGLLRIDTSSARLGDEAAARRAGVPPGDYAVLAVTDNGTGMDEATRARIFEPFFTTKEVGKGTGLGLSTVFGIVEQSGGHVTVESKVGAGTTFRVYIPRAKRTTKVSLGPPVSEHAAPRGGATVLLVEDEDLVRNVTRTLLRRQGYRVLEAGNAGEALLICEQHEAPIDLLLTDVVMPRMSGRQLADRVRGLRPEMRVLFMSGYTDDAVVRHGVEQSELAFLQKPITADKLGRKVREALGA